MTKTEIKIPKVFANISLISADRVFVKNCCNISIKTPVKNANREDFTIELVIFFIKLNP